MFNRNNSKLIYIIAAIFSAMVLIVIGYFIYTRIFPAKLEFIIAPKSAKVTMDGETLSGGQFTKRVQPGEHKITVEKTGFEPQSATITAIADQTIDVLIALVPNSPDTINWYIDHPDDSELNDTVGSRIYTKESTTMTDNYPIVSYLPEIAKDWAINYGICPDGQPFCILISANTGLYTFALEDLATLGDTKNILADYPIAFTNYTNPFPDLTNTTNTSSENIFKSATNIPNASFIKSEASGDYLIGYISYFDPTFNIDGDEVDIYRIILKQEGNNWKVLTKTALVFSFKDYPDIPKEIINLANSQN